MPEPKEEVLLDGNALAVGKSFWSIGAFAVSDDGQWLAYSTDTTGYRQYVLEIKDLRAGRPCRPGVSASPASRGPLTTATLFFTTEDATTKRSDRFFRATREGLEGATELYEEQDERFNVGVGRSRSDAYLFLEIGSLTSSEVRALPAIHPEQRVDDGRSAEARRRVRRRPSWRTRSTSASTTRGATSGWSWRLCLRRADRAGRNSFRTAMP